MSSVDRVLGYPQACTMSDNGAGKVRVTLPGNALDPKFYAAIAVDGSHYLDNVTQSGGTAAITAKGGSKAGGYYFDLGGINYPSAAWAANDQCIPIRQSTAYNYTSIANLLAAVAVMDVALVCRSSATLDTWLWGAVSMAAAPLSIWGMPCNAKVLFSGSSNAITCSGDISAQTSQITFENFTIYAGGTGSGIVYSCDAGKAGAGFLASRIWFTGYSGCLSSANVTAHTEIFHNCVFLSCYQGLGGSGLPPQDAYNCFFYECSRAIYFTGSVANVIKNCMFMKNASVSFSGSAVTYCASDIAISGTGCIQNQTRAQLALWQDNDGGFGVFAARCLSTSTLIGAGNATGAPTVDIDMTTRPNPPSIGPHEGTVNAFGVTWPTAAQSRVNFTNFAGAQTGGCTIPAAGDLRAPVQCGAGGTEVRGTMARGNRGLRSGVEL